MYSRYANKHKTGLLAIHKIAQNIRVGTHNTKIKLVPNKIISHKLCYYLDVFTRHPTKKNVYIIGSDASLFYVPSSDKLRTAVGHRRCLQNAHPLKVHNEEPVKISLILVIKFYYDKKKFMGLVSWS